MSTSNETPEVWESDKHNAGHMKFMVYPVDYVAILHADFHRCRELLAEARREREHLKVRLDFNRETLQMALAEIDRLKATATPPANPVRKWTREYQPGECWYSWLHDDGFRDLGRWVTSNNKIGAVSLGDGTWCLPYIAGDTENDLPGLPDAATGKQSPTVPHPSEITDTRKLSDRVGAINMKLNHVEKAVGSAEDRIAALENLAAKGVK